MNDQLMRERIDKRLSRMKWLFIHVVLTIILVLGLVWSVEQLGAPLQLENDLAPLAVLALLAHAFWVMFYEARYFIIDQETRRNQPDNLDVSEKTKRDSHFAIDDDGELVEVTDESAWDEKPKHGSRATLNQ